MVLERRVLVMAPTSRDAELVRSLLEESGIESSVCPDAATLCAEAEAGAGSLLIAEEAADPATRAVLATLLSQQPSWSDLPILILTEPGADSESATAALSSLGNVTLLERPLHVGTLISALRAALRGRCRQYELRDRFEAQALLAAIVTHSDDAIVSKTLQGVILSWNKGAERMFGYTEAEAVGRPITMLIPPDRQDEEHTILEQVMRGEGVQHFETVRITKDGRHLDISLTVSPVRDSLGRIIGASKVARDVSVQRRAERALRDADRRKDEFLAMLAHELRNPLAPIRNSLALLERPGTADPTVESVRAMMERQVSQMVRLVDDLMEVSRITRGKIELRRERIDLAGVIRGAIETSEPWIHASELRLSLAIPPEPMVLHADPVRLTQVFANLLNNAAKYGKGAGEIQLSAWRNGSEAVVVVRDFGVGVPADMLHKVFDMFTQLDSEPRVAPGGLGIGLTLVRGLVELHGGQVTAESEGPGKGSAFTVRLPLVTGSATPKTESGARGSTVLPIRVLVVDDNVDSADSMGMLLRTFGAEVEVVHDGHTALQSVPRFHPEMVLLDLGMPGIDGYEVARRIREQPSLRDVTLVALSGWGQEEDRRRSRDAGFDHHLIKPASREVLEALAPLVHSRRARVSP